MTIICKNIDNIKQLRALSKQWHELNNQTNNGCLFTSPLWILNWYEIFWQKKWQLYCFAFFKQDTLVAIFPFYYQTNGSFITQKQLFILGQGEQEKSEVASEYVDVLIDDNVKPQVVSTFYQTYLHNKFDSFNARAVKKNAKILQIFKSNNKLAGLQYQINTQTWSSNSLTKNSKKRYKRAQNQLKACDAKFLWVPPDKYRDYWSIMSEFHQKRWLKKSCNGAFAEQDFHQFHQTLMVNPENIAMSALLINNTVIAINYYLVDKSSLYFYQSGWDDENYSQLSPGFMLHIWSIEHAKKTLYDFMLGPINDSYKNKFNSCTESLYNIDVQFKPIKHILVKIFHKIFTN